MITDISINIITLIKKCFVKKLIKILKSRSETFMDRHAIKESMQKEFWLM